MSQCRFLNAGSKITSLCCATSAVGFGTLRVVHHAGIKSIIGKWRQRNAMCSQFGAASDCSNCGDTGYRRQKHSRLKSPLQNEAPDNEALAGAQGIDSGGGGGIHYDRPESLLGDTLPDLGERE